MDWFAFFGALGILVFFAAWYFRSRNRRRNIWPTQGILQQMAQGARSKDKFDEEQAFLQAASEADRGYTNVIKLSFLLGATLLALSVVF